MGARACPLDTPRESDTEFRSDRARSTWAVDLAGFSSSRIVPSGANRCGGTGAGHLDGGRGLCGN